MYKKWKSNINSQKALLQKIKNSKGIAEYMNDIPEPGYMRDNISKQHIAIKDCKTSSLRRYTKLLTKYYNLCQTPEERKIISDKQNEISTELNKRPDAIITHDN